MDIVEHFYDYTFIYLFIIIMAVIIYFIYLYFFNDSHILLDREGIVIPPELFTNNKELKGTVLDIFKKISEKYPNLIAIKIKKNNEYEKITYQEYYNKVLNFAESIHYWLGNNINTVILGSNSTGWFYSHLGTMLNKGTSIGIYPTSSSEHIEYILQQSDAKLLVIDGNEQLEKLTDIKLYGIKMIVYYSPIDQEYISKFKIPIINIVDFMNETKNIDNADKPSLNDNATLIYTSGTTGDPKGAIITHKNIMASVYSIINDIQNVSGQKLYVGEKFISYLPLNHILAQLMDIYIPICTMGIVWIADKNSLKNNFVETLKKVKPNVFVSVPRLWEKITEKIEEELNNFGWKGKIVKLFNKNKIISEIGLDQCKLCVTSGSPLSSQSRDYLTDIGINLYDIYGMTETTGPITLSFDNQYKLNSVGKVLSCCKVKIAEDGEILIKGPTIFNGYYKNNSATKEILNNKWLSTGDLGYLDNDGFLFINGRKKDIIITRGGENISANNIENNIKKNIPFINYAVLVGDNKKYLTVLLVIKTKNEFSQDIHPIFKTIDPSVQNIDDILNSNLISKEIQKGIDLTNKSAPNNINLIQKWKIIPSIFKINYELTPTLKIKRFYIYKKYKELIDSMYDSI